MPDEHANTPDVRADAEVFEGLSEDDRRIIEAYIKTGVPVDFLAYTTEFDRLYEAVQAKGDTRSRAEVFRRLLNLRKRGQLPRMLRSAS